MKPLARLISRILGTDVIPISDTVITEQVRRSCTRNHVAMRQQELLETDQQDPLWYACKMAEFSILVTGYREWL